MTRALLGPIGKRILTFAMFGAVATCTEDRTPLAPVSGSVIPAALVSGTITHTPLASGNNIVNQKIYTTASIAPAPNALVTVAVLGHNSTSATASPTVTGAGMTWALVGTVTFDAGSTPHKRLTIYRALSSSPGSGPLTITWSASQSNC